jgi:hypothetical protein
MIIEYRARFWQTDKWEMVPVGQKPEEINFQYYSIRINKNRQYHRVDTPGFIEEYNKAMSWMMLQYPLEDKFWDGLW